MVRRLLSPAPGRVGREFEVLKLSIEADGEKILVDLLLAFGLSSFFWVPPFDGVFCLGSLFEFSFDSLVKPTSLVMLLVFLGVSDIVWAQMIF